jgi:hypothetical protein
LPNNDEEYDDAATAIRKTKAAIDGYLRKKKRPKTLLKKRIAKREIMPTS